LANHRSAIKRHRQSEQKRLKNRTVKSGVKTAVKRVRAAVQEGNVDEAKNLLKAASSELDSAASKGVLHKNNASRRISRLHAAVNSITPK